MKLLSLTLLILITTSCSHINSIKKTDSKNIFEVKLTDNNKHNPTEGQTVKVFDLNANHINKRSRNGDFFDYLSGKAPINGKIIKVISKEIIMVELDESYVVTDRTRVEF